MGIIFVFAFLVLGFMFDVANVIIVMTEGFKRKGENSEKPIDE